LNGKKAKQNISCRRVMLCGAYGMDNLGDDASCQAVIAGLRDIDPTVSICLVTRAPQRAAKLYGVNAVDSFDFASLLFELSRADALIFGGGSLLQNVTSRRSLYYYLALMRAAKRLGCTVMLWGSGMGPVTGDADIKRTARTLNSCADAICLRDEKSLELLREIGVTKPEILLSADPVFSLDFNACAEADNYIGVCLRECSALDGRLGELCAALELANEKLGLIPEFFVLNPALDSDITRRAASLLRCEHRIAPCVEDAEELMQELSSARLMLSVRLHGAVFASIAGVPSVGIGYDPKLGAFFDRLSCGKCLNADEISRDTLYAAINSVYNENRDLLNQRIKELKSAENVNRQTAARYIFCRKDK